MLALAVMAGMLRTKLPVLGLAGPCRVSVPDAAVAPLKTTAPVLVPVAPKLRALAPCMATVPVKLAEEDMVCPLTAPEVVTVPMLTRLPLASMRWVPPDAPVFTPVVALTVAPWTVVVVVMLLAVLMVPKPLAMLPAVRLPTFWRLL